MKSTENRGHGGIQKLRGDLPIPIGQTCDTDHCFRSAAGCECRSSVIKDGQSEATNCEVDVSGSAASSAAASDSAPLLPVLEKHEVQHGISDESGSTATVSGGDASGNEAKMTVNDDDCGDLMLPSRPEVVADDRKSASFDDDDEREMPELTLYA